jgi:carbon-monoxide dehydrogenase small subunit
MKVELKLNGLVRSYEAANGEYLLETLRRNNVHSVRRGCDSTSCGVCTVLLDGKPVPSCSVLTLQAAGHEITTVEGIAEDAARLSVFFGKEGADQCGYCNPALALVVHALKKENPHPTPEEIDQYLVGNLCRCSGYKSQHKAIAAYLEDKS